MEKTKAGKTPVKKESKAEIVIKETEDDVLVGGFSGNPDEFKEEIKKEAEKSDLLTKYILPFLVFILIAGASAFATWYYAKPERREEVKQEDKIQTPPTIQTNTTPAPTPTPVAPQKKETTYTVQEGDTMSSIANANGMSSQELASYNGITDVNNLHIGQVLKIPVK